MALTMAHTLSQEAVKAAQDLKDIQFCIDSQMYGTIAALLVVLLDHGDTIGQEIKFVWRARLSAAKVIFLIARYFGLFVQTTNLAASVLLTTGNNTTNGTCNHWHMSLFGPTVFFYTLSSVSLTMKIYELSSNSPVVKRYLVGLHTFQVAAAFVTGYFLLNPRISYTPTCDRHTILFPLTLFGVIGGVLEVKFFFWGYLICRKALVRRDGWMQWWHIIITVFGDGTYAWIAHSVYIITVSNYAFYRQHTQPHLIFSWPITIHIIATCRILLHQMNPDAPQILVKVKQPAESGRQPPAQISSNHVSERSRSRRQTQEVSRGAPSIEPSISTHTTHSRGRISSFSSDAIQVVPRSVLSTRRSTSDEGSESSSDAAEFTVEEGNYDASVSTCSDIQIGSEHTNTSISSAEQRELWNDVLEERSYPV